MLMLIAVLLRRSDPFKLPAPTRMPAPVAVWGAMAVSQPVAVWLSPCVSNEPVGGNGAKADGSSVT